MAQKSVLWLWLCLLAPTTLANQASPASDILVLLLILPPRRRFITPAARSRPRVVQAMSVMFNSDTSVGSLRVQPTKKSAESWQYTEVCGPLCSEG
ncbi:hypothetical protein BDV33DRAFT_186313 [Aspergillus novoparasiticus]|uniref:Uncharacterized protein n=1 Tax=Aspergillus novoparasiticus TaxID=986946 RepID=A0A5N6E8F1_9EURO|nr:hypothetical protein BDV33DRAFT_186313 [Aspergillus novoparasiticus]